MSREDNGWDQRTKNHEDPMGMRAPGKVPVAGIDLVWLRARKRARGLEHSE